MKKSTTGRYVVVDDVKDFGVHPGHQPSPHHRVRTVVHERQGDAVGAAHVKEEAERVDSDSPGQRRFAGSEHDTWSDDDIGNPEASMVFRDKLILFELRVPIRVKPFLR